MKPRGVLAIDARAARWHWGHGIGTYTAGLVSAMPSHHLGHQVLARGLEVDGLAMGMAMDMAIGLAGESYAPPPPSEQFWQLASEPAVPRGDEVLWHNPHSGIGLPDGDSLPLVVTVHDLIPLVMPQTSRAGFRAVFEAQVPRGAERAARLIAPSEHCKADLVRLLGVSPGKVSVTGEAPPANFRPIPKEQARARVAALYGVTSPYVLYVGGFSPRKNVATLIRAFAAARTRLPTGSVLCMAGNPDHAYGQVGDLAHRLGCAQEVMCAGYVAASDLPCLYSGAEVFVYPSLYEGFGLPPLEAMACGCPVVCSDATSLPEVCGPAAEMVDARDPEAMAEAMMRVVLDRGLAGEMTRRGLARAARFTWPRVAEKTLAVYAEALASGGNMRRDG